MTGDETRLRTALGLLDVPECGPPVPMERYRSWRITRRADCLQALRHPAVRTIDIADELRWLAQRRAMPLPALSTLLSGILFVRHADFHQSGRAFLSQVHAAATAAMAPDRMAERAGILLRRIAPGESCDLVPLCNALPLHVVSLALGLDEIMFDELDHAIRGIMATWASSPGKASLARLETEARHCLERLAPAFDRARRAGSGVLHDALLLGARQYGFGDEQIASLLLFLILAAMETSSGFLANIVLLLQKCPELAAAARESPQMRPKLIGEALRYLGPVRRASRRHAIADIVIGERRIPAGTALLIDFEAANHDGEAYPAPWQFDLDRAGPPSLAFGSGAHACIGAAAARTLATRFMDVLADYRLSAMHDALPEWDTHPAFRIPRILPGTVAFLGEHR